MLRARVCLSFLVPSVAVCVSVGFLLFLDPARVPKAKATNAPESLELQKRPVGVLREI